MKRVRAAVISATACLMLAACGQADREPTGPTPTGPSPTGPSPTGPSPTAPVGTSPTPAKPSLSPGKPDRTVGPLKPVTLSGTVTEGVEANCLLLRGYLLVGGDRNVLRAGATVTVTGHVERDLLTTCQQGTPFRVEKVQVN